jgi:uncharacterized membrane protein (DUF2068 family)
MDRHPKDFFVRYFGLRGVALFEASKGVLGVAAGIWVLSLRHKDMKEVAERLLQGLHRILHVNPDRHLFQTLMRNIGGVTPHGLRIVAALIMLYAVIRFIEAAGLWLEKEWAEWFALISGAVYTPFLVYELARHPTVFKWWALGLNLLVVAYMAWLLRDSYKRKNVAREMVPSHTAD